MRRIAHAHSEPLYGVQATRDLERAVSTTLPAHTLMARAGWAVARLACALAPHARCIWVACGPGNNGGDGLIAATHLHRIFQSSGQGGRVVITLCGEVDHLPADAQHAWQLAHASGVPFANEAPSDHDFAIDAMLGIGARRAPEGRVQALLRQLQGSVVPVLCVDLPSGLNADTGTHWSGPRKRGLPGTRHTLSLLTLKPGLFTGDGRDQAGHIWFDDLGIEAPSDLRAQAWLSGQPEVVFHERAHAAHKGIQGDVLVVGGQHLQTDGSGMTGAAILAARAALHAGAGRVYVGLLSGSQEADLPAWDPVCPELMFRQWASIQRSDLMTRCSVVCGCGGGGAVASVLPQVLMQAPKLVLDADALNAIAADTALQAQLGQRRARGQCTVLTPHPLEAARLLGCTTTEVMADRLAAAQQLADRFATLCVLKGSGSVIAGPLLTPHINPTGNALLATAGTGDVLAGTIACAWADAGPTAHEQMLRVCDAVFQHGQMADRWLSPTSALAVANGETLTASRLAQRLHPLR